jgi:hypothetical protein
LSRTASRQLILDGDLLAEIDQVRDTLKLAKLSEQLNPQGLDAEAPRLKRRLLELSEKAASEAVRFTVRALPGEEFDDLCRRHPLSPEQLERFREHAKVVPWAAMDEYNPVSMGPDLLVACLVEPDWPEEEIREFWKALSKGEQNQLWNLALGVQVQGADVPFFDAATATTIGGGDRSTMPVNGASRSQSS